MGILCALLTVYMVILVVRAIMSWFPIRSDTPWAALFSIVFEVTEPALAPLRRMIPPAGPIDVSFLVLFFGIVIVRGALC